MATPSILVQVSTNSGFILVRAKSGEDAMEWAARPVAQGGGGFVGVDGWTMATNQTRENLDNAGIYSVYPEDDQTGYYPFMIEGHGRRIGAIRTGGDSALQDQIMKDLIGTTNSASGVLISPFDWEHWIQGYDNGRFLEQPINVSQETQTPTDVTHQIPSSASPSREPGVTDPSYVDPVQGFLEGLGFGAEQYTGAPSASAQYLQRQGSLGAAAHYGQNVADYFGQLPGIQKLWADKGVPDKGFLGAHTPYQFGQQLGRGEGVPQAAVTPGAALGAMGPAALTALAQLSNIGQGIGVGGQAGENRYRQFLNPINPTELQSQRGNIANLLTAAMQGSGMSPMYAPQVYGSDIDRLWTQYAAANPNMVGGFPTDEDTNFLNFASGQYGLNRFFPTTG